ncbi:tRNA (guanosine(46)-N7)-methyltransferase TrmB [Janibacter corallicola]|uniref:tRNA (guanosine(46)-N7)-methyltransferase TrmB n=1 Tax=Janibacter corallicola TaxID=415212 RepID=UPI0009FCA2BB|nr:tRNA (guanosine(46)-N7)-methyltransferase TrmB [Janibacter corallicola]
MTTSEPDHHRSPLGDTPVTPEGRHRATVRTFTPRWRISRLTEERMERLLPRYTVPEGPLEAAAAFGRELPVVLEIGSGHGDAAIAYARAHPEHGILTAEVHVPGVARMMAAAEEAGVENLRVFRGDAIEYLTRCVATDQLEAVHLFFPDPWPKARHAKRRFVQQDTLDLVLDRLRPGGHLLIATDHAVYAEHVRSQLAAHEGLRWSEGDRPAWRPDAGFEAKGVSAGRSIHEFRVVGAA